MSLRIVGGTDFKPPQLKPKPTLAIFTSVGAIPIETHEDLRDALSLCIDDSISYMTIKCGDKFNARLDGAALQTIVAVLVAVMDLN